VGSIIFSSGEVIQALRVIRQTSQGVSKALRDTLEQIQNAPGSIPELEWVPPEIAARPDVCVRKAKVINHKHDFRILFFHWRREDGCDRLEIFDVFPRRQDYAIDWDWVKTHVGSS